MVQFFVSSAVVVAPLIFGFFPVAGAKLVGHPRQPTTQQPQGTLTVHPPPIAAGPTDVDVAAQQSDERLFFHARRTHNPERKIAFLGDSLMAGFADLCNESDASVAYPAVACETLGAECNVFAAAGMGMYRSAGSTSTAEQFWDLMTHVNGRGHWFPNAVVVNLGTNDNVKGRHGEVACGDKYRGEYGEWLSHANEQYNSEATFFLACGPSYMDYCDDVRSVVATAKAQGIKAVFLNMTDDNIARATECMSHPGVDGHKYLADKLTEAVKEQLDWH